MRLALCLFWLSSLLVCVGCGPSAEEQASESFATFAREWVRDSYPGDPVLKETTTEVARGESVNYNVERGYYRRRTIFEGLECLVTPTGRAATPYRGTLRGHRIVQSTPIHADRRAAERDASFTGARFVYPEEHSFQYLDGHWRALRSDSGQPAGGAISGLGS